MAGIDVVTLFAIGLLLVIVSLPRLRVLAREDNQSDAFEIALTLYRALEANPELVPELAAGSSLDLLVARSPVLRKRLEDVELLDEGRRLRCHGYLFDVVRTDGFSNSTEADGPGGPGSSERAGSSALLVVRAWPWHHERTGRAAYVVTPTGEILEHENHDGRFGGEERAPAADLLSAPEGSAREAGWRSVKLVRRDSERVASAL